MNWNIRILTEPKEMILVEDLQRQVWGPNDLDIVPAHLFLASVHSGGLVLGAYSSDEPEQLIGFVFGFPAMGASKDHTPPWHHSHLLAVHPDYRDHGLGFALKRAQWQMVRQQGLERITWTYDPMLSANARLNIAKLGAVCNTYQRDIYGELRDKLNAGFPTDRFIVDWWVNSRRVGKRLSRKNRISLDLAHYIDAGTPILNRTRMNEDGWSLPAWQGPPPEGKLERYLHPVGEETFAPLLLAEISAEFQELKAAQPALALDWRLHIRYLFEALFSQGYLVTDFLRLEGTYPRSFYVLSYGEQTL